MAEAAKAPPTKPTKAAPEKAAKEPKEKKESVSRSNFNKIYPDDAKVTITTEEGKNPKRPGSKAHDRFELYRKHTTVGEFLAAGGTYSDIAYNVGRGFVKVG